MPPPNKFTNDLGCCSLSRAYRLENGNRVRIWVNTCEIIVPVVLFRSIQPRKWTVNIFESGTENQKITRNQGQACGENTYYFWFMYSAELGSCTQTNYLFSHSCPMCFQVWNVYSCAVHNFTFQISATIRETEKLYELLWLIMNVIEKLGRKAIRIGQHTSASMD